jgi:hypothetical protein
MIKFLATAAAAFAWAAATAFILADTWAVRHGRVFAVSLAEEAERAEADEKSAAPVEDLNRLTALAPWDGVLLKRAADAMYLEARRSATGHARDAEAKYIRALRRAPGHYLTAWALGAVAFEHAPETPAWVSAYGAALRLFPVHRSLKNEFAEKLCRQTVRTAVRGSAGDGAEWFAKAVSVQSIPYWTPFARGAVHHAKGNEAAWAAFRQAVLDIRAMRAPPPEWVEHAQTYFMESGDTSVREGRWNDARRWFDLAGAMTPEIGKFLRRLDEAYGTSGKMIWGGKPSVVWHDYSGRTGVHIWRGLGKVRGGSNRLGVSGDGRTWEEIRAPQDAGAGDRLMYWTMMNVMLQEGDDLYFAVDVQVEGCPDEITPGLTLTGYWKWNPPGTSQLRHIVYGGASPRIIALPDGWTRVVVSGVAENLRKITRAPEAQLVGAGPVLTPPCAVVRVSNLTVGLM